MSQLHFSKRIRTFSLPLVIFFSVLHVSANKNIYDGILINGKKVVSKADLNILRLKLLPILLLQLLLTHLLSTDR